jgi:hypothetical protein
VRGCPASTPHQERVYLGSVSSAGALDQLEHVCNVGVPVEHVTKDQTVFDLPTLDVLRARTAEQLATHVAQPTARVTIVALVVVRCRCRCSRSQSMTRSLSRSGRDRRQQAAGPEWSWRGRGTPPYERAGFPVDLLARCRAARDMASTTPRFLHSAHSI